MSDKDRDQGEKRQPAYGEHLKRVKNVRRTLEEMASGQQTAHGSADQADAHVSHESLKDQAVSRKTRRPVLYGDGEVPISGRQQPVPESPAMQAEDDEDADTLDSPLAKTKLYATVAKEPEGSPPETEGSDDDDDGPDSPLAKTKLYATVPKQPGDSEPGEDAPDEPDAPLAKTQLYATVPKKAKEGEPQVEVPQSDEPEEDDIPLAKTMLYDTVASAAKNPKKAPSQKFVAKTLIDHSAILQAQAHFSDRHRARLELEISEKQQTAKPIEPIKTNKTVSACPFSWNEESTKERFKYCGNCQASLYNLDGLEFADAESLIFKRENRKKFALYKRPDGKFMTSPCPVAQQKKKKLVGVVAICICIIFVIGGIMILMPPAPPTASETSVVPPVPDMVPTTDPTSGDSSSSGGSGSSESPRPLYKPGDPIPAVSKQSPTGASSPSSTGAQEDSGFTPQEESGDFWQF